MAEQENVRVVATAMKLSAAARAHLSEAMGPDAVVVDMRDAPATADIVLAPVISPQTIGRLKAMFPRARVLLTEVRDDEFGVEFGGPVQRAVDAGADGYVVADDLDAVASFALADSWLALGNGGRHQVDAASVRRPSAQENDEDVQRQLEQRAGSSPESGG